MTINDYMNLFPAFSREKPRFAALAEAVLQQAADLMALVPQLASGFSFSSAEGVQLDVMGDQFQFQDSPAGMMKLTEISFCES